MDRTRKTVSQAGTRQRNLAGNVVPDSPCRPRKHAPESASAAFALVGKPSPTLISTRTAINLRPSLKNFNPGKYSSRSALAQKRSSRPILAERQLPGAKRTLPELDSRHPSPEVCFYRERSFKSSDTPEIGLQLSARSRRQSSSSTKLSTYATKLADNFALFFSQDSLLSCQTAF